MLNFSIGLSAIRANQVALDTVAQNIANANTPGYHRQVAHLVDREPFHRDNLLMGTGVDVAMIQRLRYGITEAALTGNISDSADTDKRLEVARRIESFLVPSDGSLYQRMQSFFDGLSGLSTRPDDVALRGIFLQQATSLTTALNRAAADLNEFAQQLETEVVQVVEEINTRSHEIADLNKQITLAEARDLQANDLRDRRDQLVNELAKLVDVEIEEQGPAQSVVIVGSGAALIGRNPISLEVARDDAGNLVVRHEGIEQPMNVMGGQLAGLLAAVNEVLPEMAASVSSFTTGLVETVDGIHATGLGLEGPMELLLGQRSVSDVTAPLVDATNFNVQSGDLFIGVVQQSTGERILNKLSFDPATQSLQDLAAAISGLDHLQAVIDPQQGTMQVIAEPGYAFDFTGDLQIHPDTGGVTGSTVPTIEGDYSGAVNEQWSFLVNGSGTVGVTPGLTLEVRDASGQLIALHDIGETYEPDSALAIANGVSVRLASGTVNNGDSFDAQVVAQPDTTGLLTALGLNTFFVGTSATDLAVHPDVLNDVGRLALSKTGLPGDVGNLARLLGARDRGIANLDDQTLEEYFAGLLGDVGGQVQDLQLVQSNLELMSQHLLVEREAISGVDPNEELVHMLQFQRSFQAAARYISTINETFDDLFRILP